MLLSSFWLDTGWQKSSKESAMNVQAGKVETGIVGLAVKKGWLMESSFMAIYVGMENDRHVVIEENTGKVRTCTEFVPTKVSLWDCITQEEECSSVG
jgi:hypothetical protein